ncbi:hypothetical protein AJ79_00290 [Helicocarpus griseus UAMH5409]|uniref:Cofilin n=1 Tax=Helicocarpus griseus UAMH5409 TaxID=1447875 RepID=A0A2B7Y438_9EURO|nr:hypothetical protein AJ79_00290 [Helicocarpus griseus UAMH5409]
MSTLINLCWGWFRSPGFIVDDVENWHRALLIAGWGLKYRVQVSQESKELYSKLKGSRSPKYIIFKISDDKKQIVVEDSGDDDDYEVFRNKLIEAKDSKGKPAPRYAVYDGVFDLGTEGIRNKIVFISWVPADTPTFSSMIYASTRETLKNALNLSISIHADDKDELEWAVIDDVCVGKDRKKQQA